MKAVEFCYWLQGYFEINDKKSGLNATQVGQIKKHLNLVFKHEIDPSYENRQELDKIHAGDKPHNHFPGEPLIRC